MGKHSEVFVAFDVAKKKHAVAIAEPVGPEKSGSLATSRTSASDRADDQEIGGTIRQLHVCFEAGPTDMGFIAR